MPATTLNGILLFGSVEQPENCQPYEQFSLTHNPDGTRTLRSITQSPNGTIFRDVHQTVAADWRPVEGYARLFIRGEWQGTIWRRLRGDRLLSELWSPDGTVDTAEFTVPPHVVLGFHPVVSDSWKLNFYDVEKGGQQELYTFTVSNSWNGRTLGHGMPLISHAELLGRERITVPAGTFECEHFLWADPFGEQLDVWRWGPDNLLIQLLVRDAGRFYQLGSLEQSRINIAPAQA